MALSLLKKTGVICPSPRHIVQNSCDFICFLRFIKKLTWTQEKTANLCSLSFIVVLSARNECYICSEASLMPATGRQETWGERSISSCQVGLGLAACFPPSPMEGEKTKRGG